MSLLFHYELNRSHHPLLTLGGRFVRPRPIIPVTVTGPAGSSLVEGTLDTSADDTVFRDSLAAKIGLDLTKAPVGSGAGAGMARVPLKYAQVTPLLASGQEQREWTAWVGFTRAKLRYPMFGFAGFLQFFDTVFRGAREEVEL